MSNHNEFDAPASTNPPPIPADPRQPDSVVDGDESDTAEDHEIDEADEETCEMESPIDDTPSHVPVEWLKEHTGLGGLPRLARSSELTVKINSADDGLVDLEPAEFRRTDRSRLLPTRRFASRRGQRHRSCLYASRKLSKIIACESLLERIFVLFVECDPAIVRTVAQPAILRVGRLRHFPDFLIEDEFGQITLIAVKYRNAQWKLDEVVDTFTPALAEVGIGFEIFGEPGRPATHALEFIDTFRVDWPGLDELVARYLDHLREPFTIGWAFAQNEPDFVLAMWRALAIGTVGTDLRRGLSDDSVIEFGRPSWT